MKVERGQAALITGGGGGIGRALAVALAKRGVQVSVLDLAAPQGEETVRAVTEEHARISYKPTSPSAIFIRCDVTNSAELTAAFAQHQSVFGRLDICINNAGVIEKGPFYEDSVNWRKVMDVNLNAVIEGTKFAVQAMKGRGGQILNIASAAGLYPSQFGPLYSSSKGGVVMFTRALVGLKKLGIRANVLCPEFIETPFLEALTPAERNFVNRIGYVTMERVLEAAFSLFDDERQIGACVWVPADKPTQFWPTDEEKKKYRTMIPKKQNAAPLALPPPVPSKFQKVVVHTLSSDFRAATRVVTVNYKPPVKPGHVLIKYLYVGINASDINYSAGRYHSSPKEAAAGLPLDSGFEAVGLIAAVGDNISRSDLKPGSPAATVTFGGFSEYREVPAKHVFSVPAATPEVVAMLTSGLTASIGLEQAGRMKSGETVLVTAAAGGTGQFAVQLAKIAGNKVVATCGGADKAALLRELGVDRVIDYRKETVKEVLKKEFPKGVNVIYESVGGQMFDTCMKALAVFGRMVVIGMISQYTEGEGGTWKPATYPGLCEQLLWKSQTISGFFLVHYAKMYQEHIGKLYNLYSSGKLKILIDPKKFVGVHSVADAVEHLHSGKSLGKVVVQLAPDAASSQHASRL
ncbi:hypothetical protein M758_3G250400 [Ceratodon purpureus]|nr:hypothetical protein M758_3G250400 [Ceratodon purpureus]